jgi:hypothetical protein
LIHQSSSAHFLHPGDSVSILVSGTNLESPNHHKEDSLHEIEEAPYCTFSLSMDKVRYSSFKFKVWEDKNYLADLAEKKVKKHSLLKHDDSSIVSGLKDSKIH